MSIKNKYYKVGILVVVIVLVFLLIASIRGDYSQMQAVLKKVPIVSRIVKERIETKTMANNIELSKIVPSFEYLKSTERTLDPIKPEEIQRIIRYLKKVVEFFPDNAEAHGLLGYCYYQLEDQQKASDNLIRALQINPRVFSFNHNLGIIYFMQNDYLMARKCFVRAVNTDPQFVFEFILKSPVYRQIFREMDKDSYIEKMKTRLVEGLNLANRLLAICDYYINNEKSNNVLGVKHIQMYMF